MRLSLCVATVALLLITACGESSDEGPAARATANQTPAQITTVPTGQPENELCIWVVSNATSTVSLADPVAVEAAFAEALGQASQLRSSVPNEVANDFELLYTNMVATNDLFSQHNFSLIGIPDGALEALSTNELLEAASNISSYCGAAEE